MPIFAALAALSIASTPPGSLSIQLSHGSEAERDTRDLLVQLGSRYDLKPYLFTRAVLIDEQSLPHSHPVLTIHARHRKDPELLLSTFLHEEAHWFVTAHYKKVSEAIRDLRILFPVIPLGGLDGSSDEEANYVHLIVIYLEYRADREYLGELRSREIMNFWSEDHYRWLYKAVLDHGREIGAILIRHDLLITRSGPLRHSSS